jgi:RNA polymerase sigma-70 factor (ECF subfamily)
MRPTPEFEDLFVEEYPRIVRTVFFVVQDRGRAEEVTQDAFVALLRHWSKVRDYDRPGAWVRRVAIRLAVKTARREQRQAALAARLRPQQVQELPVFPISPQTMAAIRSLPVKERAVAVLHYFEDRPVDQIAELLECTPSAVKMRLSRARHHLADLLAEEVSSHVG